MSIEEFIKEHGHIPAIYYSDASETFYTNGYDYGRYSVPEQREFDLDSLIWSLDKALDNAKGGQP